MSKTLLLTSVLSLGLLTLTGCGTETICKSTLTSAQDTYIVDTDSGAEQSRRNACNLYCLDESEDCEGIYQIWKANHPGATIDKTAAMYQEPALLDCVTMTCADQCLADVAAGDLSLTTQCN